MGQIDGSLSRPTAAAAACPLVSARASAGKPLTPRITRHHARVQVGAASVRMASFLSKPSRRAIEYEPDYLCFEVPDKFVVGYGLDFDEQYRSLPYLGVLRPECYARPATTA